MQLLLESSQTESTSTENQKTESSREKRKLKRKTAKNSPKSPVTKSIDQEEYGILVVDDHQPWTGLYKTNLFQNEAKKYKFKFFSAHSSRRGIQLVAENYPDIHIVILDLNMPKKDGIYFLETVVDKLGIESLGVFIVTSYGTDESLQKCMLRGARGFYDKSHLDFRHLSRAIYDYIEFKKRHTAIELGLYVESRPISDDVRYLYLRWNAPDPDNQYPSVYLGKTDDIETIRLPNVVTDLSEIEGFKKKKPID
jgi:CheY-like chemotaxis protein